MSNSAGRSNSSGSRLGAAITQASPDSAAITQLSFSPDGLLATASADGTAAAAG